MACDYLRHINLQEVYEQIEEFTPYKGASLSNIQHQFGETLSFCFEELSYAAFEQCPDDAWKVFPAAEVAAEVGDIIEASLERIAMAAEISMPSRRASANVAISKLTTLSIHASFGDFDYWEKISLMTYQYDLLCWLYRKSKIEEAFEVYELILRTHGELATQYAKSFTSALKSELARDRATKRHAPTNRIKLDLLAEWDKTSGEYKSRADFCRIISQRDGLLYRTVYDWIATHDRNKS
ncbi:hypothetical protein [Pseudomonas sp. TWP3-1]|uniref:hypothetical protein n=1 Tax=Pseudomonas sp. TWP3-1 TaxID=2804631 RepID=UPI003CEA23FD